MFIELDFCVYTLNIYRSTSAYLQSTPSRTLLRLGQLILQDRVSLPRAASIAIKYFFFIRSSCRIRPFPQLAQARLESALHGIHDFIAKDREELITMATASGSKEETVV